MRVMPSSGGALATTGGGGITGAGLSVFARSSALVPGGSVAAMAKDSRPGGAGAGAECTGMGSGATTGSGAAGGAGAAGNGAGGFGASRMRGRTVGRGAATRGCGRSASRGWAGRSASTISASSTAGARGVQYGTSPATTPTRARWSAQDAANGMARMSWTSTNVKRAFSPRFGSDFGRTRAGPHLAYGPGARRGFADG
jgi:hypothetical protein